eukprot:GHVS01065508.1.p1 GENE.GHVS01065508.1~~GHVS01065508.1.p1  ORF type:complete len:539 (+),score=45.32 GHVS01065508.1:145-1761(+)
MAQVFSAALFLLLPIVGLLTFTLATDLTDGVAHRLSIGTSYTAHKRFADTSVTLDLGNGESIELLCADDGAVTAQKFSEGKEIGKKEQVTDPALVIEEKSLVFIKTESSAIRTPLRQNFLSAWLYPTGKKDVIWDIDSDEAEIITKMLIGVEASDSPFGLAFREHLEKHNGTFSNEQGNWRGTGSVKLIRYDQKIYVYGTEKKELGWRSVGQLSGVITVKGLLLVEIKTVRIDALDSFGFSAAYDITFACSARADNCVFQAMFDDKACSGKRTAEGLFGSPWEMIEKYADFFTKERGLVGWSSPRARDSKARGGLLVCTSPRAYDSIGTRVFASLSNCNENGVQRMEGRGELLFEENTSTEYTFRFAWNEEQEAIRVYYKTDEEAGWRFSGWENWSHVLVDRIIDNNESLKGFRKIKDFNEGFFVDKLANDKGEFTIGKYFKGWRSFAGLQVPINGNHFVGFCGGDERADKFIVDDATWVEPEDDSWPTTKLLSEYVPFLSKELGVLTLSGKKIETEDEISVKLTFREDRYISCVVTP